jgi:hypothetical protein
LQRQHKARYAFPLLCSAARARQHGQHAATGQAEACPQPSSPLSLTRHADREGGHQLQLPEPQVLHVGQGAGAHRALHHRHGAQAARRRKQAAKGGLALQRDALPKRVGMGAGVQGAHLPQERGRAGNRWRQDAGRETDAEWGASREQVEAAGCTGLAGWQRRCDRQQSTTALQSRCLRRNPPSLWPSTRLGAAQARRRPRPAAAAPPPPGAGRRRPCRT